MIKLYGFWRSLAACRVRMFKPDLSAAPKLCALAYHCLTLPALAAGRMAQGH